MTIEAPETRVVDSYRIACDGGEGALGHPRIWLQIPHETGWVECPYCDCKYVHSAHAPHDLRDETVKDAGESPA
ncbi:zinc-finger domain-containing protein [Aquicoccus sp. SCR17]|nr:zinc-finger domain-containing protein [Carideicomes alvinocaridis]